MYCKSPITLKNYKDIDKDSAKTIGKQKGRLNEIE